MSRCIYFCLIISLIVIVSEVDDATSSRIEPQTDHEIIDQVRDFIMEMTNGDRKQNSEESEMDSEESEHNRNINDDDDDDDDDDKSSEHDWINYDPKTAQETRTEQERSLRVKRQLIIPGTNWCGVGNVSTDNQAMGDVASLDKCCYTHDHCPYAIAGFSTKYNLYNFRFHTISHCECDDIFRTCLKMSHHERSQVVGDLFFNVIGMKCFVFKKEQVCAERAWWGKCERYKYQWNAETRDPIQY